MFPNLSFFVGQNEGHVSPIVDRALFGKKKRAKIETAQALKTWFKGRLAAAEEKPVVKPVDEGLS
jgi:hypothetical protein